MEMPIKFEVTANKVGNSLKITLPTPVANYLDLKPGEKVEMWEEGNKKIIIAKKGA